MSWATTQAFTGRYSDPAGTPTHDEQCDLAMRAQAGDVDARNEMVRRNMGLVYDRVDRSRWRTAASSIADMEQEGVIGLMTAIEQFNPGSGYRFSTYARWWIDGYIRRYLLANQDHAPIRVAVHALQAHFRAQKLSDDERQAAEEKNPMLADARRALAAPLPIRRGDRNGEDFGELVDPSAPPPSAALEYHEEHAGLRAAVGRLDVRHAAVIRRRYGLGRDRPALLREVADEMGCSVEFVRQLEHQAIRQLRAEMDPDYDTETPGHQAGRTADAGMSPAPLR